MSLYRTVGLAIRKPDDVVVVLGDHRDDTGRGEDGVRTDWVRRVRRPTFLDAQGKHLIQVAVGVGTKVHGARHRNSEQCGLDRRDQFRSVVLHRADRRTDAVVHECATACRGDQL